MTPHYTDPLLTLYLGDCLEVMPTLPDASVDAVVTDPPYGLEFMGKEWDRLMPNVPQWVRDRLAGIDGGGEKGAKLSGKGNYLITRAQYPDKLVQPLIHLQQVWHEQWAREAFRLLKPGGHLLAFGGTRTVHRLASAIEDAGFEIRDCLVWAYASGFPKSLDVGKAIDRAAGNQRGTTPDQRNGPTTDPLTKGDKYSLGYAGQVVIDAGPATDDAKRWDGWGTALKPAWEPIVMARKPLQGTVAANVLAHGVGALNIDGSRIGMDGEVAHAPQSDPAKRAGEVGQAHTYSRISAEDMHQRQRDAVERQNTLGRWPANVILTDPIFDGDTPGVVGGGETPRTGGLVAVDSDSAAFGGGRHDGNGAGDTGTYSRFFLIAKEARAGREPAVRGALPSQPGGTLAGGEFVSEGRTASKNGTAPRENVHPTVKPLELMRHLVRLVTPPGGLILDPFLGSGTTALAAINEGFRCIGVEREAEYMRITMARLPGTQTGIGL